MAFSQIDPARLRGDALRQWYLRSPADVEEEKRQAASSAYHAFFSNPEDSQSDRGPEAAPIPARVSNDAGTSDAGISDADVIWRQIDPNRYRSERASAQISSADTRGVQLAAANFPAWGRWPINGCFNCHDTRTGDLLPGSGPTPRPPTFSPRYGGSGGGGSSSRRGEWSDKPQCNQQFEADRKICRKAKSPMCWTNQTRRLGHCDATGEVGTPALKFGPPGR